MFPKGASQAGRLIPNSMNITNRHKRLSPGSKSPNSGARFQSSPSILPLYHSPVLQSPRKSLIPVPASGELMVYGVKITDFLYRIFGPFNIHHPVLFRTKEYQLDHSVALSIERKPEFVGANPAKHPSRLVQAVPYSP